MAVLRRLTHLLIVLVLVTFLVSLLVNLLPGSPALAILGQGATPRAVAAVNHDLHLDRPLIARYGLWLAGLFRGDFGSSYINGQSIGHQLALRIPVTLEEIVLSQVLALAIAVPLGMWSGFRPHGPANKVITSAAFLFLGSPPFVLAELGTVLFAVKLGWLPAAGFTPLSQSVGGNLRSLVMPCTALGLGTLAVYIRLLRAELTATLQQNYIEVAYAKGLSVRYVLFRHALRPSLATLVAALAVNLGALIGGAVVVESIFSIPGVGSYMVSAIQTRDYIAVQGAVVVVAVGFVAANALADSLHVVLDPRSRRRGRD